MDIYRMGLGLKQAKPDYPFILVLLFFSLNACENERFMPAYSVEFPPLPAAWQEILGPPHWQITWINPEGTWETVETHQEPLDIRLLSEWTTPVIAYPYWPEHGVFPNTMRPGGGLFPFDYQDHRIRLTWRGGVEALVYRELAAQTEVSAKGTPRLPHYFNWPRFRALLEGPLLHEAVQQDLWSADWKGICVKIAQSGFDRRRIVPQPRKELLVPVNYEGPWIGTSPFGKPLYQEPEHILRLQIPQDGDTYFSSAGILRCTQEAWMWFHE